MKRKSIKAAEADLTPMLDIVFILLIFFIVTATFIQENAIDMTPPPPSRGFAFGFGCADFISDVALDWKF